MVRGSHFCSPKPQTRIPSFSLKNSKTQNKAPNQNLIHQTPSKYFQKLESTSKSSKTTTLAQEQHHGG
jgi:hypothetical protein